MIVSWIALAALAGLILLALTARFTFWRPDLAGTPILMYHYLTDELDGTKIKSLRVRPLSFDGQMKYLKEKGYNSLRLEEFHRCLVEGRPVADKSVIITFDDGSRHCLTVARDILKQVGFTAVVFVVTNQVGASNAWDRVKNEPEVDLLDWEELKELVQAGWEIGSHTMTHADLTTLTDDELAVELEGSRAALEENLGLKTLSLAYPYGLHDERVRQAAAKAGYVLGLTILEGKNTLEDDPMALKRIIIKRRDNLFDLNLKLRKGRSTL